MASDPRIRSDNYLAYRDLVFSMLYDSRYDGHAIFAEHLKLAKLLEAPSHVASVHTNEKAPDRKLRIGYVSPDFRRHVVAYFIEPVLSRHDRQQFEIFCYYLISSEDEVTARIKSLGVNWRSLAGIEDERAADMVKKDGIDILVDLAGHTGGNRLSLFALKPAPVQATWLGYPATTGLSTMDYKIVDGWTDPPGLTEQFYSEKLVRLPECFMCYMPEAASPRVGALPATRTGEVTFGSFNIFAKETPEVIALWSSILKKVPDSLLILKAKAFLDASCQQKVRGMFTGHGVDSGRIDLLPFSLSFREHMSFYNEIDIGLDPFPYPGATTTCESLWMGVPVITLEGNTHVSRMGVSLLSNVGLPGLIAKTPDEYVEIAAGLAADIERLKSLRESLRSMMEQSPLTDAKRFTMNLENCYRKMWEKWCKSA